MRSWYVEYMNAKYLFLDCEMGGADLQYSLLSVGFIVTNSNFDCVDTLSLNVKPDDGVYIVSAQGLNTNKIDLVQHDLVASPYKSVKKDVYDFLHRNSNGGSNKIIPVGHGIQGDIKHILKNLISIGSWNTFCSYHFLDTSVVFQFLRSLGKIPNNIDGSTNAIADYFNIGYDKNKLHTAIYDSDLTRLIYSKMVELIK